MKPRHSHHGKRRRTLTQGTGLKSVVSLEGTSYLRNRTKLVRMSSSDHNEVHHPMVSGAAVQSYSAGSKAAAHNDHKHTKKEYCKYFNKLGYCNSSSRCRFIHDAKRIMICPKFLEVKCDGSCSLLHEICPEKMPVCSFYMRGICKSERCPYRHVRVDKEAPVCPAFVNGYCTKGDKCRLQHVTICPNFLDTGVCTSGKLCQLRHLRRPQEPGDSKSDTLESKAPLELKALASHASLPIKEAKTPLSMRIRPRLLSATKKVAPPTTQTNTNTDVEDSVLSTKRVEVRDVQEEYDDDDDNRAQLLLRAGKTKLSIRPRLPTLK